ncbi:MAG TPA: RidA family protein [Bryobacteraceae bacterium]|nr:RidA family protein [Bryobacteraceae bacterium]
MNTRVLLSAVLACAASLAAPPKPIVPAGVKPVGPYTPGLDTGEFVYVSGQGARDAKGVLPSGADAQVRQCLENVKAVLTAGGLTMDHVVYAHVYLTDLNQMDTMNKVWVEYFPKNRPARSTIGVLRMPTETPVEITAVAVRDLKTRKAIVQSGSEPLSTAVLVGNRVFLSSSIGRESPTGVSARGPAAQVQMLMTEAEKVLKQAGLELRHLVHANIYVTRRMPMPVLAKALDDYVPDEAATTIVQTASLPGGVDLQFTGIASRDLKRYGNCTGTGNTIYCSGRAGTIRQALASVKADLEANKLGMNAVVATNVYIDDLDEFAAMNKVYATFFGPVPPTRTTVQPSAKSAELSLPPATGAAAPDDTPRALVSVVAVRP